MMDEFRHDDVPIPNYVGTDRPVAIGDRGACPVPGGAGGLVISLRAYTQGGGNQITAWSVKLRYPNGTVEELDAHELHWIEPTREFEIYLTDADVDAIRREPPVELLDRDVAERIIDAVREAVTDG